MAYAVLLSAGLVGGFFLPQRPRGLIVAALLAGFYVAVVTVYAAAARNYDVTTALSFLLLPERVPVNEPGLGALVIGAGIWVVSVIVAAVRLLLSRARASGGAP
jgi:hypothetical protein